MKTRTTSLRKSSKGGAGHKYSLIAEEENDAYSEADHSYWTNDPGYLLHNLGLRYGFSWNQKNSWDSLKNILVKIHHLTKHHISNSQFPASCRAQTLIVLKLQTFLNGSVKPMLNKNAQRQERTKTTLWLKHHRAVTMNLSWGCLYCGCCCLS